MNDTLTLPLADAAPKKRVRATIADTVAIGRALEDRVRSIDDGEGGLKYSYQRGDTDEVIAKEYVPHLAAHHVTAVREALYPRWEKRTADLTVEERLEALEKWAHEPFDFTDLIKRIVALERYVVDRGGEISQ